MLSKYRGVILGLAYADALGAGYEFFKGRIGEDEVIDFLEIPKITAHKKYEWSDDTAMVFDFTRKDAEENYVRKYIKVLINPFYLEDETFGFNEQ
jgi:ADP-ribosylglycohydrolase